MEIVIAPKRRLGLDWKELKEFRELVYFFVWRDFKVRYKQTFFGIAWAVFQPVLTMVIFTVLFNRLGGISVGEVPYPIFSYAGLLYWHYFQTALTNASNSLVTNQAVISKVYFPRIIPPFAATLVPLIDFFFAGLVFILLMIYYGIQPTLLGIIIAAPMLFVALIAAAGAGSFFAALNVRYRDVREALPYLFNLMLFATPVIYPVGIVPERFQWILYLNPMTGVITAMRGSLLHQGVVRWNLVGLSFFSAFVLLIGGVLFFQSRERRFADVI